MAAAAAAENVTSIESFADRTQRRCTNARERDSPEMRTR
jgi:hypothetical protein